MRSIVIFLCLTVTWVEAQNGRAPQHQEHNGHGWDIRLAVPGEPGNDYPTLGAIPRTSFSCAGREPGYYADVEANCQAFRVCTVGSTYGFQSFLCPNGTLFNQAVFVCDWWMNVNCKESQQLVNTNEQFQNLKLGPQLMKDIKKMLTHPMRNPYDRNSMKSNLIVMQDYKPPVGQLFPNGALLAGPERQPNNVYIPAKQTFSASTPDPRYLPASDNNFQSFQGDDDYFQRQRQSEQYVRNSQNFQNSNQISNSHTGRFIQNSELNSNSDYTQIPQSPKPTQISKIPQRQSNFIQNSQVRSAQNNPRNQINRQRAHYSEPRKIQPNIEKQTDFGVTFTEPIDTQSSNASQDRQPYSYSTPSSLPQFSTDIKGKTGRELKENLAFVYSFLADSINVAREYRNIAQQEILSSSSTTTPAQFPNVDNAKLSDITNRISDLTSSQFSNNIKYTNEHNPAHQLQAPEYNRPLQQTQNEFYSSKSPTFNNQQKLLNNKQVYSGQLYQWPVPEHNTNQNTAADRYQQSNPALEIIKAQTLPVYSAKLQLEPSKESEQLSSQESVSNLLNRENGISAHLQDKIVGSLPHPLEDNKIVTFENDQSYYLYTKFKDDTHDQNPSMNTQQTYSQQNTNTKENNIEPDSVSFQFIPSINYELEDEKEQQNILDAFQIDEFGAPREITKTKSVPEEKSARQLMMSVDYSVEHPTSNRRSDEYTVDSLYSGPSSYTAPQSTIGNLKNRRNTQNEYSSRLEDFDIDSSNGYPRGRPTHQFIF